jgi:predicted O-methyltransferase YrrM
MVDLIPHSVNGYYSPSDPGEPGSNTYRLSVNDLEARVIASLCARKRVLEIGTGLGVSTRAIQQTAAALDTIDIDPWVHANVFPALRELGVGCSGNIDDMEPASYDACFIDGAHDRASVYVDIVTARLLVKPGGMLIFHDTRSPGVVDALRQAKLPWVMIDTRAGIGIAWNDPA